MQPNQSGQLSGIESGEAGGGNSNTQSGIAQAIGFVTEFNQNVQIFEQTLWPMLLLNIMHINYLYTETTSLRAEMIGVHAAIRDLGLALNMRAVGADNASFQNNERTDASGNSLTATDGG